MDELISGSNKVISEIQEVLFPRLERVSSSVEEFNKAITIEVDIEDRLKSLDSNCERLAIMVSKLPPNRRSQSKIRVDQIRYDSKHLSAALRNMKQRRHAREMEEKQRADLLTRRYAPNASSGDTSIPMDYFNQESGQLNSIDRNVDDLISVGTNALLNIRNQKGMLAGAHRKILEITNTLGMSNTVMRLIEKRAYRDKFILFGGMILFCIFMLLMWKFIL